MGGQVSWNKHVYTYADNCERASVLKVAVKESRSYILQAILFYTPRWLWKGWEGGKIHALMMDLDIGLCSEVEKKQKKKMLLDYLWENLRFHNWWAYRYYLCEVLAFLNVIGESLYPPPLTLFSLLQLSFFLTLFDNYHKSRDAKLTFPCTCKNYL